MNLRVDGPAVPAGSGCVASRALRPGTGRGPAGSRSRCAVCDPWRPGAFANRWALVWTLVLALSWAGLSLQPAGVAAEPVVLARTKAFTVTQDELDEAFVNLRATLAAQGRDVPEAQRASLEGQLLEKLVLTKILLGKATAEDRKEAQEKVEKLLGAEKAKAKTQARFEAQVRAAGMSPELFEKQLNERAVCEEVLARELRPKLGVTPEKVRAFYDANPTNFRQPERIRLLQVVLSFRTPSGTELTEAERVDKKSLAGRLVERLRQGEDFAAIARDYSDDPAGRERGGEYVFPVGRMVPEFELALSGLATNQVSDVIATPYGYHVVKLIERLPGEQIPFDTVSASIQGRLELEANQALLPEFQKALFAESAVEFTRTRKAPNR